MYKLHTWKAFCADSYETTSAARWTHFHRHWTHTNTKLVVYIWWWTRFGHELDMENAQKNGLLITRHSTTQKQDDTLNVTIGKHDIHTTLPSTQKHTYAIPVELRCGASSKLTPPLPFGWLPPGPAARPSIVSPSPKPSNDSPSESEEHCDFGASV